MSHECQKWTCVGPRNFIPRNISWRIIMTSASESIRLCDLHNSLGENNGRNWAKNWNLNKTTKDKHMEMTELRSCWEWNKEREAQQSVCFCSEVCTSPERKLRGWVPFWGCIFGLKIRTTNTNVSSEYRGATSKD